MHEVAENKKTEYQNNRNSSTQIRFYNLPAHGHILEHAISNGKRKDVLQKQLHNSCIHYLPLTFRLYFLSVLPASLVATHVYSPLSEGVTEAMTSSVPSSRTEIPGSLPVSSLPLCSHLMTGFGIPNKKM